MKQLVADPILTLWRHRGLLRELTRRELSSRFVGSMLGAGWIVLQPIALLLVYVLVFGFLRVSSFGDDQPMAFVSRLFVGILVFALFSETVSRAPRLVVARPNFVTKIRFPLEVLPVPGLVTSLVGFLVGLLVLVVFRAAFAGGVGWAALATPVLVLPLLCGCLGLSWVLSSVGVFIRDLQEIVRVIVQLLFFLSPVVWTVDIVPEEHRGLVLANPIALTIEWVRAALAQGTLPDPLHYLGALVVGLIALAVGLWFFRRTREGFGDVL